MRKLGLVSCQEEEIHHNLGFQFSFNARDSSTYSLFNGLEMLRGGDRHGETSALKRHFKCTQASRVWELGEACVQREADDRQTCRQPDWREMEN